VAEFLGGLRVVVLTQHSVPLAVAAGAGAPQGAGILRPDVAEFLGRGGIDADSAIYRAAVRIQSRYRGYVVRKVARPSVRPFVRLPVCSSACHSVRLSVSLATVAMSCARWPVRPSIRLLVCLTVW
jgi:IQ calmodulin-binding motif